MTERHAQPTQEGELFRLLVENVRDYAIFVIDPEGRVRSWNPGAERLLGYREEEIIGRSFARFFPPDDIEQGVPQQEMEQALRGGRGADDRWHVRKDGSPFWCGGTLTPLWDADRRLRGFAKIMRDRTEWKRAEEEREERTKEAERRQRLYDAALSNTPDLVYVFDRDHRFVYANAGLLRMWGKTWDEAVGKTCLELGYEPWHAALHDREIEQVVATRQPVKGEVPFTGPLGRRMYEYIFVPVIGENGAVEAVAGSTRDTTDRKRVEDELREASAILSNFYDTSPLMMGVVEVLDDDVLHLTDNRATGSFFGLDPDALRNRLASRSGVPPAHLAEWVRHYRESDRTRRPVRFEYPHQTAQGPRWLSAIVSTIGRTPEGGLRCSYVVEDVTERKRAEDDLRESEERFRQLADAMPQIVWTARPDGQIDYLNRRWQEFTGLPAAAGNTGWDQILHPDDAPAASDRWAASVRTGEPFEMEVRLLDRHRGAYRWHLIRTVAARDEAGTVTHWFGTSTDIHEQKRAAESSRYLAGASAALASVVDYESTLQKVANLAVPYFADWSAVDVAGDDGGLRRLAVAHRDPDKVRLVSELMREYPPDPHAPRGGLAVFRSGQPVIVTAVTDAMLAQGARDDRHLRLIRSLGLKSYLCVPLVVSGRPFGVLTFATAESGRAYTDVDLALAQELAHRAGVAIENTRLYQALRDTDRRKDEFLATLAHELRNPLAPIRNALQILGLPGSGAATAERARAMMERQVQHLVRLVDDLLDVSRVMRGKIELRRERTDLATIVARAVETVQPLADARGHELSVRLPPEPLPLDADPVRLVQVVGNLLTNAAKYTDPNGRIRVTAERAGDDAVLRVRDTGIGIAPDDLARVFELFVQVDHAAVRSQGGLGIGLTLVKNLCEMHAGSVEAKSAGPGTGSEFVVRLPLATPGLDPDRVREVGPPAQPAPRSGHRLLVVDDNRDAADSLGTLLGLLGHEVRVVHDGPAALELVTGYRPALVFLDLGMPGMDGYEVARRMRRTPGLEATVLAALTGWGQSEDRRRTAEAGFDHHLVKPVEPDALKNLLAALNGEAN